MNSGQRAHFYIFLTLLLIGEILLNLSNPIRQFFIWISNLYNKYEIFFAFFVIPILFVLLFGSTFWVSPAPDLEKQKAALGVYSLYITISTVFLSVALVIVSLFPLMQKRSSGSIALKRTEMVKISKINAIFLYYSITSVMFSLFGYFLTSLSTPASLGWLFYEYFAAASFFLLGSIFGIFTIFGKMGKMWLKVHNRTRIKSENF